MFFALNEDVATGAKTDDKTDNDADERIEVGGDNSSREGAEENSEERLDFSHNSFTARLDNYQPDSIDNGKNNMPNIDAIFGAGKIDEQHEAKTNGKVDKVGLNV